MGIVNKQKCECKYLSVCVSKGGVRTIKRKDWADGLCGYVRAGGCWNVGCALV